MKRGTCDGRATEGWTGGYCQECDNARRAANGKAFRTGIPVVEPKPMTPHERAASQRPVPPIPQAPKGSGNGRGRRQGDGGGRGRNGGRNGGRRERAANAA